VQYFSYFQSFDHIRRECFIERYAFEEKCTTVVPLIASDKIKLGINFVHCKKVINVMHLDLPILFRIFSGNIRGSILRIAAVCNQNIIFLA
jgi:hypothetical protein